MPDLLPPLLLGAIQGLTEFLPISSSGHLLLAHELIGFDVANDLTFDVALHLGTLVALLLFFWQDVGSLLRGWFTSFTIARADWTDHQRGAWMLVLATLPAVIIGGLFETFWASLRSPLVVISALTIVGLIFLVVERRTGRHILIGQLSWGTALGIGLAQVLALVPGVSRSGITIVAGMLAGLSRPDAARFTFLMSIPTVAGAAIKKLLDLRAVPLSPADVASMLLGILSAGLAGYFVVRFLLRFLSQHRLDAFAYYRFALAAGAAVFLYFR